MKKFFIILIIIGIFVIGIAKTNTSSINHTKIIEAQEFINKNKYNSEYCIFVNFSAYSGSKRFMLYSFKENKIIYSCKCAHGNDGSENSMETTEQSFSNVPGSHKSSLGKYKIGKKRKINSFDNQFDVSMFNIPCYEMYGLDKTNSNAYRRGILIHPGPSISVFPIPMFPWQSFGCFSIPVDDFYEISKYIDDSKKPMLLYAYYK